ncbi:endonuclease III domain-containing protein [Azohydromonas caseinilytica]|uniref:Endonuclease III n=1 Tax=Azohydromonas caseinilytica TaxID=2728836 RepID=A0A848FLV2_9BURK|nr:endonuclease III [Azohydromonas caseinilytica]NML18771.1 endonuclease III [Azohydromonas caseinilytica]
MSDPSPDLVPFSIDVAMERIREAVQPYPKAALFELADEGFNTAFEQLVACMISIRTRDETMLVAARRLFQIARTPAGMAALSMADIDNAIADATYHELKAAQIQAIARTVLAEHGGELPCDEAVMLSFRGIGPKCTNLVLGIACGQPRIGVDIHVHRVTNRWGYVRGRTPEGTLAALERVLPRAYWVEINRLLVPFGKHICTGTLPRCSTCPVRDMCRRVGVTTHR